jgi:hypothetical protein
MKLTAQIICETNKIIIKTPFEDMNMEYSDEMGKDLFIAILLYNSFMMKSVAKTKLQSPFKEQYGEKLLIFVVDGSLYDTFEVSLCDDDIDVSTVEILKKLSTKKGKLCLVD